MASTDHTFYDYSSVDEILDVANSIDMCSQDNEVITIIKLKQSILETLVFQPFNE